MRRRLLTGSSLIEVLVVLVIFLVGILAFAQIFPTGLSTLRSTRNNTQAENLARAEMERIQAQSGQLPEMIMPVSYQFNAGSVFITVNPRRLTNNLMPDQSITGGEIDSNGDVILNGNSIGNWQMVSGSNLFNRVIGEGQPVPGPSRIPGLAPGLDFGSLLNLKFAPIYDDPTLGVLTVYGNDFLRQFGNRQRDVPGRNRVRPYEYYYVDDSVTDGENFPGEDQIWVGPFADRQYRISFSFFYDDGASTGQYQVIVPIDLNTLAPPPFAKQGTELPDPLDYWVVSIPQLISQPDIYGNPSPYLPGGYRGVDPWSIRVQRVYERLAPATPFDPADPYEYKVVSPGAGFLLINPRAATERVRSLNNQTAPLTARADYTVYDWRIIRDEFRVPQAQPFSRKLILGSIQPKDSDGPDNRPYSGMQLGTPDVANTPGSQDFILYDVLSGGVILGNDKSANSGYWVDKITGAIEFRDVDGSTPEMSAYISYPTGNIVTPWSAPVLINDISNRQVRALYRCRNQWSVQPFKAASNYRVAYGIGGLGLAPGEAYVGATNGGPGAPDRVYFPPADLGSKVIIRELWYNAGAGPQTLNDQEFQVDGYDAGLNLSYLDINEKVAGAVFDFSQGYSVRGVIGASMKVRVLWNPNFFSLTPDNALNYERLEEWQRGYRKIETQNFVVRGTNR